MHKNSTPLVCSISQFDAQGVSAFDGGPFSCELTRRDLRHALIVCALTITPHRRKGVGCYVDNLGLFVKPNQLELHHLRAF